MTTSDAGSHRITTPTRPEGETVRTHAPGPAHPPAAAGGPAPAPAALGLVLGAVVIGGLSALVNDDRQLDRIQDDVDDARGQLPSAAPEPALVARVLRHRRSGRRSSIALRMNTATGSRSGDRPARADDRA